MAKPIPATVLSSSALAATTAETLVSGGPGSALFWLLPSLLPLPVEPLVPSLLALLAADESAEPCDESAEFPEEALDPPEESADDAPFDEAPEDAPSDEAPLVLAFAPAQAVSTMHPKTPA